MCVFNMTRFPPKKSHSCTIKKTVASTKATTSMLILWSTHNKITVPTTGPQPSSMTTLGDNTLFDFISFAKQQTSQIAYDYHDQKVAFNTMASFIKTGLDQQGRNLYSPNHECLECCTFLFFRLWASTHSIWVLLTVPSLSFSLSMFTSIQR